MGPLRERVSNASRGDERGGIGEHMSKKMAELRGDGAPALPPYL